MSLTLYYHPLSSACWNVLTALYENGAPFTPRIVDLSQQSDRDLLASLGPAAKMPVLQDQATGEAIPETSIIIEWLDLNRPTAAPLIPAAHVLDVRLWDRVIDFYIHEPMQRTTLSHLFMSPEAATEIAAEAQAQLARAYASLDRHLAGKQWAVGDVFTMADCAASPALFYAGIIAPFDAHPKVTAYFERLIARPSVARVLEEAKPWFKYYPFLDRMPARFL